MTTTTAGHAAGLPAGAARGPISVEWIDSRSAFRGLAPAWEALADRTCCRGPFFLPEWFAICAVSLAGGPRREARATHGQAGAALRLLVAHRRGVLVGALPLVATRARLSGVPVRLLRSLSDDHSQRFDVMAEDDEALGALWRALSLDPGWDVLELRDVPEGGAAERLVARADAAHFPTGRWASQRSPYLSLPASPDEIEAGLDRHFRGNLRRRGRRLAEEVGPLRLERIQGPGRAIDEALDEGFALEASGWKGRAGTAVALDPRLRIRYRAVARALARRGALAIHFLRAGDRRVAFHFAAETDGVYYLFKPGHDDALGRYGPGHLLMLEVARDGAARGLREIDLLGDDLEWKRSWTATVRAHAFVYVLRPGLRGQALRAWKFEVAPRLGRVARRLGRRILATEEGGARG